MVERRLAPVTRRSLLGPPEHVAPALLGRTLIGGDVRLRIVEVEAYSGVADEASHAFRGATARNAVMFGPAGHGYVYFTYGMHYCMNVVTGPAGQASAVLLRAAEVVAGIEIVRDRRTGALDRDLARGPARLCKALGIDRSFDGVDLCNPDSPVWLAATKLRPGSIVSAGPRVGITKAIDRPWRFWIDGDPHVSVFRPGTRRAR